MLTVLRMLRMLMVLMVLMMLRKGEGMQNSEAPGNLSLFAPSAPEWVTFQFVACIYKLEFCQCNTGWLLLICNMLR